jgi:hypothetical protein
MRNAVLLLLGLAIGAIATANILPALLQRDAYPRGLMNVLQHHYARLREDAGQNRCTDTSLRHLELLRALGDEIPQAVYGSGTPDAPFREYQQRLHEAVDVAAPACANLPSTVERIGAACDACHHQYR